VTEGNCQFGSENIMPEQWYRGLTVELWRSFGLLRKVNLKTWWQEQGDISPVQLVNISCQKFG
jgi:hypothetical protein